MQSPVRFAFAVHLHQPVGNLDVVFQEHLDEVYRPLLSALYERGTYPFTLHLSGPLLDWLAQRAPDFLEDIGTRVSDGRIELLASGRYEPILAALEPADRIHQIEAMRETLRDRFGTQARGLWLTERVWEQDLAADLARAGISYTLLDDRHFMSAGVERSELDQPFRTESGGHPLTVLPIDERLRYLIPFRPAEEIEAFFRARQEEGTRAIVLGDDGEKFGGWPDTRAWVYDEGWLDDFLLSIERLQQDGVIALATTAQVADEKGGGLVYPSPGSYREMEEWTLPRPAALRLERLWQGPDEEMEPHLRGGHWKGFLRKYPESNRMHKTALQLSRLCRQRGNPPLAREAIGRAQCNDAYWHGVFGGVYLPHLRQAVWRDLAGAEATLRRDEALAVEELDWDSDGDDEMWVHSSAFSAIVSPRRGGSIECLTYFSEETNFADVFSRRLEPYHSEAAAPVEDSSPLGDPEKSRVDGVASVHDRGHSRPVPPFVDPWTLAVFQERWTGSDQTAPLEFAPNGAPRREGDALVIELRAVDPHLPLGKRYRFESDGTLEMSLTWPKAARAAGTMISTSIALSRPCTIDWGPGTTIGRERIVTLARSERGFEEVDQGERLELAWPLQLGSASVRLGPPTR